MLFFLMILIFHFIVSLHFLSLNKIQSLVEGKFAHTHTHVCVCARARVFVGDMTKQLKHQFRKIGRMNGNCSEIQKDLHFEGPTLSQCHAK